MRWFGIDAHHLFLQVAELREDRSLSHYRIPVSPEGLDLLKAKLGSDASVILEASTGSFRLHDELQPHASRVVVAHPSQTRGASALHVKTDIRDAEVLARLLASDFVRPVWVPSEELRGIRGLLELRDKLGVQYKGALFHIQSLFRNELKSYPPRLSADCVTAALDDDITWPTEHVKLTLTCLVECATALRSQIRQIEKYIAKWVKASPDARLLDSIPGVGPVVAAIMVSEIGDVNRFATPAKLCAYAGIVPRVDKTGKTLRIGRMSHQGRRLLRWGAWIAALYLVRADPHFKAFYDRVRAVRDSKKVALVGACRKLLGVVWHMLRTGQEFRAMPVP